MEINSDILDVLPTNNKNVAQFKDFIEKYGTMDNITFVIESEDNRIDEQIELIENLAKRLIQSPLIAYVDYSPLKTKNDLFLRRFPLFLDENGLKHLEKRLTPIGIERQIRQNRQKLLSPISSPFDYELIARDPLNLSDIVKDSLMKSHKTDRLDFSMGYYFTTDYSTAFIFAKPKGKSRDMAFVKELKKDLNTIILLAMKESGNPSGVQIGLTGGYILSDDIRKIIRHDIITSTALSVFLIALLIWLVYRVRARVLIIIGFTMLTSLAMTLAFAFFLFGSLNVVTSIVAAVLIGLYVDYSMHTVKRFSDELRMHNNPLLALEATITKTGAAIIISGITTSLSFFSILVTEFRGLYELGVVAGIGVMLCLISTLFLMNALLVWLSKPGFQSIQHEKRLSSGVVTLTNFIIKNHRYIILTGIVFICFAGYGISMMKFDNNPDNLNPKDCSAIAVGKKIGEKLGKKGVPLNISVKAKDEEELTSAFDALEKTLSRWERDGLIESYHSLSMFMPAPSAQSARMDRLKEMWGTKGLQLDAAETILNAALKKNNLVHEDGYIHKYLNGIVNAVNNTEFIGLREVEAFFAPRHKRFYNKDNLSIAAYLFPTDRGWDKQTIDVIQGYIKSKGENWILTGKSILFREMKPTIIWSSTLATLLALLLNFIIIYLYFKKIIHVMLVLLPVTVGFILTMGIMGYMQAPFNYINVGTIALIFGLGVDDGIYVMQAYTREDKMDIGNALRISCKNVIMCAATTVAGCGSLITVKFTGIATIGPILSIGAITCAFTALIILPAIIYLYAGRLRK
ncbi:MAG: efflux RND transporter permease subunit [Candidatus Brocadiales bacterium]